MTATTEEKKSEAPAGGIGRVSRVIGPVVDIEFPVDQMPDIYNALLIDTTVGGETRPMPPAGASVVVSSATAVMVPRYLVSLLLLEWSVDQSEPADASARAAAPPTISLISWVISACRAEFAARVSDLMSSSALSVAAFMARRRDADSDAAASRSAANTRVST